MTIEINGMAHVILTMSRFEVAREFYRKLLPEFGIGSEGMNLFPAVGSWQNRRIRADAMA